MATHRYNPSCVLRRAWDWARIGARRFGGTVRQYLPEAMRMAWAAEKKAAAERVAQAERVRETAAFLVSVQQAAKARREADRAAFRAALAEELAMPRIRPSVMSPETAEWLRCFGEAQQREAATKVQAEVGRAA